MSLETGTRLGGYEIVEPIGAGGMGEVYRARDTKLERDVAIKVLPEALSRDQERLARFAREAKLLAQLNHPNVATLYGFEDGYLAGGRVRISTDGGVQPLWSPTTNELYFRNRDNAMAVRYETDGNSFEAGAPAVFLEMPPEPTLDMGRITWDVAPDGDRFLVLEQSAGAAPRDEIHVTTNWFEELKELVAAEK